MSEMLCHVFSGLGLRYNRMIHDKTVEMDLEVMFVYDHDDVIGEI